MKPVNTHRLISPLCYLLILLATQANSAELIPTSVKFTEDAALSTNERGELIESGVINELKYDLFHSDGSGSVGRWSFGCRKDKMTRTRFCRVTSNNGRVGSSLTIGITQKGSANIAYVSGADEAFPNSLTSLRVGDNKIISTRDSDRVFSPAQAQQILKQALKSKSILTRYYAWPYENQVDNELQTEGLAEAIKITLWTMTQGK